MDTSEEFDVELDAFFKKTPKAGIPTTSLNKDEQQPIVKSSQVLPKEQQHVNSKNLSKGTKSFETEKSSKFDNDDDDDDEQTDFHDMKLNKKLDETPMDSLEHTVFVGNVPKLVFDKSGLRELKRLFEPFGTIKSIRIRSIPGGKTNLSKKIAYINKKLEGERDTVHAYIVYDEQGVNSITQAVEKLNGILFEGKHLRVDYASVTETTFKKNKSVFLGNLPFTIEDESLWQHFESCGSIDSVRVIRDPKTQHGKGFGYIQFGDGASVGLALKLNGTKLNGREIRVKRCLDSRETEPSHRESQVKRRLSRPPLRSSTSSRKTFQGRRSIPMKLRKVGIRTRKS